MSENPHTTGYRLLHSMIRTRNLDNSVAFYTQQLGMKLLRQSEHPSGEFTLAFLGYGDEANHTVIELTYNWGHDEPYEHGAAFGHIAISVPDIHAACKRMDADGVKINLQPVALKDGGTVIAFVEDPDGYAVELIEQA